MEPFVLPAIGIGLAILSPILAGRWAAGRASALNEVTAKAVDELKSENKARATEITAISARVSHLETMQSLTALSEMPRQLIQIASKLDQVNIANEHMAVKIAAVHLQLGTFATRRELEAMQGDTEKRLKSSEDHRAELHERVEHVSKDVHEIRNTIMASALKAERARVGR